VGQSSISGKKVDPSPSGAAGESRACDPDWTFYYDGGCGFCTRVARLMAALDLRRRVRWMASQSLQTLPGGLTREDLQREAFRRGGVLEGGFYSSKRLALLLPPLWALAPVLRLPGVSRAGEAAYALQARNHARLPGSGCAIK